jgi:hypothetical protein
VIATRPPRLPLLWLGPQRWQHESPRRCEDENQNDAFRMTRHGAKSRDDSRCSFVPWPISQSEHSFGYLRDADAWYRDLLEQVKATVEDGYADSFALNSGRPNAALN